MIQLLQSPWEDRFRVSTFVSPLPAADTHALSFIPYGALHTARLKVSLAHVERIVCASTPALLGRRDEG